jgi:hypothetical protein
MSRIVLMLLAGLLLGCSGDKDRGKNKNLDRPVESKEKK